MPLTWGRLYLKHSREATTSSSPWAYISVLFIARNFLFTEILAFIQLCDSSVLSRQKSHVLYKFREAFNQMFTLFSIIPSM